MAEYAAAYELVMRVWRIDETSSLRWLNSSCSVSWPIATLFCHENSFCSVSIWLAPLAVALLKLPDLSSERAYCTVLRQFGRNWLVMKTAAVLMSESLCTS